MFANIYKAMQYLAYHYPGYFYLMYIKCKSGSGGPSYNLMWGHINSTENSTKVKFWRKKSKSIMLSKYFKN